MKRTFLTYDPTQPEVPGRRRIAGDAGTSEVPAYTLQYQRPPLSLAVELPPSRRYLQLLRNGAREKQLDASYVEKLAGIRPFW